MTAWPSAGPLSEDHWTDSEQSLTEITSDTSTGKVALTLVPGLDGGSTRGRSVEPGPSPDSEPTTVPVVLPGSLPISVPEAGTSVVLCKACGLRPKDPGNGRKNCVVCIAHAEALKLCQNCGAEKDAHSKNGRKGRLCAECREIPKTLRCPSNIAANRRQPCRGCGGEKGEGRCIAYCPTCRAARAGRRTCERCQERPVRRGKYMKLCVKCANNVKIAQRIYGREHWRRQRAKFLAEQEALKAPLLARLGELLELRKLDLEEMVWHVEHEITPTSHMKFRGAPDHDSFPSLPARPLWLKINRMIAEERGSIYAVVPKFTNAKGKPIVDNARRVVCLRLNVSERAYSNWQKEAATVAFDIADDVLRYAGWNWFDVWDPDDYPEVEAIFESEELTVMAA